MNRFPLYVPALLLRFLVVVSVAISVAIFSGGTVPVKAHAATASSFLTGSVVESNSFLVQAYGRSGGYSQDLADAAERLCPCTYDLNAEGVQIARAAGLANLLSAVKRNPELTDDLCARFNELNGAPSIDPSSDVQAATLEAFAGHLATLLNPGDATSDALRRAIAIAAVPVTDFRCDEVQVARAKLLPELFELVVSDPDIADDAIARFNALFGEPQSTPSDSVQAESACSYGAIAACAAVNGRDADYVRDFLLRTAPPVQDWSVDAAQAGRARGLGGFFTGLSGADTTTIETAADLFEHLVGIPVDNPTTDVQAAAAEGAQGYLHAFVRVGDRVALGSAWERLSPEISDTSIEGVQIARAQALAAYYEGVARQPDLESDLKAAFIGLYGVKSSSPSVSVQIAAADSYYTYFISMARQPEISDRLTAAVRELSPAVTDKDDYIVQMHLAYAARGVIEASIRQPELSDDFKRRAQDIGLLPFDNIDDIGMQIGRARALGVLYESMTRLPGASTQSIDLFVQVYGEVPTFPVTFDARNGAAPTTVEVKLNGVVSAPQAPVREGYVFSGWMLDGQAYDFSELVYRDMVLSAGWVADESVAPDAGGGSTDADNVGGYPAAGSLAATGDRGALVLGMLGCAVMLSGISVIALRFGAPARKES